MIDQFLSGVVIGVALTARMTWWLYPVIEAFNSLKTAIHDVLNRENMNDTDEESL